MALKGNQPALFGDVRLWLDAPATTPDDACQTVDSDHGPLETRRATVAHDVAWLEHHKFPGLAAVAKMTAVRERDARPPPRAATISSPTRFPPLASPRNRLHWVLDVVMDEDYSRAP